MFRRKTGILLVSLLLMTAFIFGNSLQTSTVSNAATDDVIGFLSPILEMLDSIFGEADWFFLIRKAAHLTEFCVLGILALWLAKDIQSRKSRPFSAHATCYVLFVAVMDEFIQSFSDRSSLVSDVLIDFCGALIGFAILALCMHAKERKNKNGD